MTSPTVFRFTSNDQSFDIGEGEHIVGRDLSANVTLSMEPTVSKRHARIRRIPEGLIVEDLNSSNGTFVDGQRITAPTLIAGGEQLRFGSCSFQVEMVAVDPATRDRSTARALPKNVHAVVPEHDPEESIEHTRREDDFFDQAPISEASDARLAPDVVTSIVSSVKRDGTAQRPSDRMVRSAAKSALRIADTTEDAKWVAIALELYAESALPMPSSVVELLEPLLWKFRGVDARLLDACVKSMEAQRSTLDSAGNAVLARLRAQAIALRAKA